MAAYLSPIGNEPQIDSNGDPLSGGMVYTYLAGTTTPTASYTSSTGGTPQSNPIVLNSHGLPSSPIWLAAGVAIKMAFTDVNGVTARNPVDNILGVNDPSAATAQSQWVSFSGTPSYISATSFSLSGDQTPTFQVGRRLNTSNSGGTVYSTIRSASFAAGITTVVVINDSGSLDVGLSQVSYGLVSASNTSAPTTIFSPVGQCRLAKSGANLVLSPYAGNKLAINGALYTIPSAGVSLAPTSNTASTGYYIYAFMNAGTMTLEYSTAGYATDITTGVAVKSGDSTRTLVGQAAAGGSNGTWSSLSLCVLSYFNRQRKSDKGSFTAARTNASTYPTYSETNSEIRVSFLVWADTLARADFSGYVSNASLGGVCYSNIGFDNTGATAEDGGAVFTAYTAAASGSPYCYALKSGLSEATIHYATQLGSAATGNATYAGGATPISRCVLQVSLDG